MRVEEIALRKILATVSRPCPTFSLGRFRSPQEIEHVLTPFLRWVALAFFLLAVPLYAQKHPNLELGFHADRLYQFTDVDSVNLFNGNLIVRIPIGGPYQANGTLAYQLTLVYNGKIWDRWYQVGTFGEAYLYSEPNWRSNASIGWRVSLGRLLEPSLATNRYPGNTQPRWVYESPAGDEHAFYGPVDNNTAVLVSSDRARLRLIRIDDNTRNVELPNGQIHRFVNERNRWRLRRISDRFGNYLAIASVWVTPGNSADGREAGWILTDSTTTSTSRRHEIDFVPSSAYTDHTLAQGNSVDQGQIVQTIRLASIGGGYRQYVFQYQSKTVAWGCGHHPSAYSDPGLRTGTVTLPFLTGIVLPDQTMFAFTYYTNDNSNTAGAGPCGQGMLESMTLPAGGKTTYEYQEYRLPDSFCFAGSMGDTNPGVKSRTTPDGRWDYILTLAKPLALTVQQYGDYLRECEGTWDVPGIPSPFLRLHPPRRWSRTTVLSPGVQYRHPNGIVYTGRRVRTDNYFYTWDPPRDSPVVPPDDPLDAGTNEFEFGRPMTTGAPPASWLELACDGNSACADQSAADQSGADQRHLSVRLYEGCDAGGDCPNGRLMRSTYVRSRLPSAPGWTFEYPDESSRTVFHDDSGCAGLCWVQTTLSNRDGTGRYRQSDTTTNFPEGGAFSVFTDYRPWTPAMIEWAPNAWLPDLYTRTERTENGVTARTDYCFDPGNGFLNAVRVRKGTSLGATDLLTLYRKDFNGNVDVERSYGGDVQGGLSTAITCPSMSSLPEYQIKNGYAGGTHTKSDYCSPTAPPAFGQPDPCTSILTTLDVDVDARSGMPTFSRDVTGAVGTAYAYDLFGRLATVTPTGAGVSSYTYDAATATTNAMVTEQVKDGATTLVTAKYEFDGLGRLFRTSESLPNGQVTVSETEYDALGRRKRVSQPLERSTHPTGGLVGVNWTSTVFDAFGQPAIITTPDSKEITFLSDGVRKLSRVASVATSTSGSSAVTSTQFSDAQGRLVKIQENASNTSATVPTGGLVTTTYGYDEGGRLTSVLMSDAAHSQQRTFEYDGRGFLAHEYHPESGDTFYSKYDARGHVGKRSDARVSVEFSYDRAERLEKVWDTLTGPTDPIKQFTFGTNNPGSNLRKGKLLTAFRRNKLSAGTIDVTETHEYATPTGQMSKRTTLVESVSGSTRTPIQQFEYGVDEYDKLNQPRILRMPTCSLNGCTVASGLPTVIYARTAGYLTSIQNFASLTYHPSGMVKTVTHQSSPQATDTYDVTNGLPRPSKITFSGGTSCTAPSTPVITAPSAMCGNVTATASVPASSGMTHTWQISGGTLLTSPTGDSVQFRANASGTVALTVTATNACDATAGSKSIPISPSPTAVLSGSTTIVRGTSIQLRVDLTGTGPWQAVLMNGTPASGSTSPLWIPVSPTQTTTYTLQSVTSTGSNCGGTVSGSATVTVIPPGPASVMATTQDNRNIVVSWQAVTGASAYQIERTARVGLASSATFNVAAPATSFPDVVPASAGPITYIYYVRAIDAQGGISARGAFDYATAATRLWANSITAQSTPIRANDVQELRNAIDAFRYAFHAAPAFGGSSPPSGLIRASDWTALVTALNAARTANGYAPFAFSGVPAPAVGGVIRSAHPQQLREALR